MSNIVVIGTGYWGKNLVRNFKEIGALYGVCDIDKDKLKKIQEEYAVPRVFSSFTEVLNNDEIDAVVIAVPAELHYQLTKEALWAGKDVFCEKPLALHVEEGRELIELAQKKAKILMIGHLLEYHPGILKLKELVDKEELGKVNYIYSSRLNLGKIRRVENILWSFAPHDISVILLLLNELPISVAAHGGNYLHHEIADITVTNLNFKSGVKAHIFVSWLHPYKEQKLVVIGEKKMAVFDDIAKEKKLLLYPHKIEWVDNFPIAQKQEAMVINFEEKEPLKEECNHFLNCLKSRQEPKTNAKKGLQILEILTAAQISLEKQGQPIIIKGNTLKNYYAHPTATIDEPCEIGENTKIWHYSHIFKGAKIGQDCNIGQNVVIFPDSSVGNNVKIQNNISVYTGVILEDDVFCGPSMVFTNVSTPRSQVSRKDEYKKTWVKKGATIGANATIVCGITINEYAFVGAGAVVLKDVPAYALVVGNPAKIVGWRCWCGEKIIFKQNDQGNCLRCGKIYLKIKDEIKMLTNEIKGV